MPQLVDSNNLPQISSYHNDNDRNHWSSQCFENTKNERHRIIQNDYEVELENYRMANERKKRYKMTIEGKINFDGSFREGMMAENVKYDLSLQKSENSHDPPA